MEDNVISDPKVLKILNENYIVASLFVDDKVIKLPENEHYISSYNGKKITMLGKKNSDIQKTKFQANGQPFYVLLGTDEQKLVKPRAYDLDMQKFIDFLNSGIEAFKNKNN